MPRPLRWRPSHRRAWPARSSWEPRYPHSTGKNHRMHRLFVLRHAKSSWNNAYQADFDRPLAPRGVQAAAAMADHVASLAPPPALVLCSTARRAQETVEPLRDRLPAGTAVLLEDDLYGADA